MTTLHSKFDRDPEALAWARAGVQTFINRMRDFERQARERAGSDPEQWRKIAFFIEREFIGGDGCVIATFDERRPALAAQLDAALEAQANKALMGTLRNREGSTS